MLSRVSPWHPWLHLLGLWTIVMAQPLLNVLAGSPEFFVAHDATPLDIVLVTVAVVFLPPLVLAAVVSLIGLASTRARDLALLGIVLLLGASFAVQLLKAAGVQRWAIALPGSLVAGAAVAAIYRTTPAVRTFASLLAATALAVPVLFLTRPAVKILLAHTGQPSPLTRKPAQAARPIPIVMVVLDETPLVSLLDGDRRIDPVLYPNLAILAHDGIWFRNVTTVGDYTQYAVPSILTGLYPRPNVHPRYEQFPNSLFTAAAPTHRLEVVESLTALCPDALCGRTPAPEGERLVSLASDIRIVSMHLVLTDDLRTSLPTLQGGWAGFAPADTGHGRRQAQRPTRRDVAFGFIDRITRDDPQPSFYFLHTLLTHYPHEHLFTGQRSATRATVPGDVKNQWNGDEWAITQQYQRHLLEMGLADRLIGNLLDRLRQIGLYDRSLIVVCADHGISFQPRTPRRDFTAQTAPEIMRVPLIVKPPQGTPLPPGTMEGDQRVSDRNAETVDIAPTIAGILGIDLPWKTNGVSLFDDRAPERREKTMFFNGGRQRMAFPREGPSLDAALARKRAIFGDHGNPFRIPKPQKFGALVGKRVGSLRVVPGREQVFIADLEQLRNADPTADAVPFDVTGRIEGGASTPEPTFVAVAVDGTVRSVTRTWETQPDRWLATPPPDSWRQGDNELRVFLLDEDASGPVLREAQVDAAP